MIQLMSAAPFMFLPILVGISAAKRFGANIFLGAAIGMIMTTPDLGGATKFWDIFGYNVAQTNYAYQVIPVLAAIWILAHWKNSSTRNCHQLLTLPLLHCFL